MAKHKIPKNRSLNEMFAGVKEELTFETGGVEDEPQVGLTNLPQGRQHNSLRKEFFYEGVARTGRSASSGYKISLLQRRRRRSVVESCQRR